LSVQENVLLSLAAASGQGHRPLAPPVPGAVGRGEPGDPRSFRSEGLCPAVCERAAGGGP
jgi:hypothetical protein